MRILTDLLLAGESTPATLGTHGRAGSNSSYSMGWFPGCQTGRTSPIGLGIRLFFLPPVRLLHSPSGARRNGHRRRLEASSLDDDRDIPHHACCHAGVRVALGAMFTLPAAADRLCVLHRESIGLLFVDDESAASGVGGAWIFCLAVGIQFVHRVGLLEFHGRSVYTGAGSTAVRRDRRRGKQWSIARTALHHGPHVYLPDSGADGGFEHVFRSLHRMRVSIGAMGADTDDPSSATAG